MPTDERILGFSNQWYSSAIRHAERVRIDRDLEIRLVTAPYILATKIEAFRGRGQGDFLSSHDMEDILTVIDGRKEILEEIETSALELRSFLAKAFSDLLKDEAFLESIPAHLMPDKASQGRLPLILKRIHQIARTDPANLPLQRP